MRFFILIAALVSCQVGTALQAQGEADKAGKEHKASGTRSNSRPAATPLQRQSSRGPDWKFRATR